MRYKRVVLIANGDCRDLDFHRQQVWDGDYIICADGGSRHALAMGLRPDLIMGDVDSLDPVLGRNLEYIATDFMIFPPEKDKSDLELAMDHAIGLNPEEILLLGALGGSRADHTYANLLMLTVPHKAGIVTRIVGERQEIRLMERELTVSGSPRDYISLFPLQGDVEGVYTEGLRYPLCGETLHFASTRSLSNEFTSYEARITAESGLLIVFIYYRE